MNVVRVEELGTFEVTGGTIMCTDPCYDRGTWCQKEVPAKDGRWIAAAVMSDEGSSGVRTARLQVKHEDYDGPDRLTDGGEPVDGSFGVDSGQFGFYDGARYPQDPGDYKGGGFYTRVCAVHDYEEAGKYKANGMVDEGPVASSGYGDGSYDVYAVWEDGRVVALEAVFIDDESDDDEDNIGFEDEDPEEPIDEP